MAYYLPGAESRFTTNVFPDSFNPYPQVPATSNLQGQPRRQQANYYSAPVPNAAHLQVSTTAQGPTEDGEPTAAQKDLDNDSEMWNTYLDEVKEEDDRITDAWKEDASSIVVFTGLFSAIVGAFIIEFYKKLSTDSGNQTVALLQQISQQLPNSPNSANSNTANQLSPPGTAMVWVNILWLISLVLSLTCALIATLLQQWARGFIETPKSTDIPRHRARVRSLLLRGAKLYKIPLIVEILPTLLHLSVFLFFGGLVITFHTIHKRVAIAVDAAVGLSGLAYIAMSIPPCLDVRCPYRTPISKMLWYPCHAFLSIAALCLHSCIGGLQVFLTRNLVLSRGQRLLESRGAHHWRYFIDGLEKSILSRAIQTPKDGDCRRGTFLFNQLALGDRFKFQKFAASIPRHRITDLILPTELDSLPLVSLLILLRSCLAAYSLDEDVFRRSLSVCLHAVHHIAKAPTLPDLDFMRAHLAKTDFIRESWRKYSSFIYTTSRSICALVARKVVRKSRLGEADLRWLQEVLGESSDVILDADFTMRDQMNFKSFVIDVLPHQSTTWSDGLSTEDAALFNETLAILLNERTNDQNYTATSDLQNQVSGEIERIHQHNAEDGHEVFGRLHAMFPSLVAPFAEARSPASPPLAPIPPVTMAPQPSSAYYVPPTPSDYYVPRGPSDYYTPRAPFDYYAPRAPSIYYAPHAPSAYYAPSAPSAYYAHSAPSAYYAPRAPSAYYAPPAISAYYAPPRPVYETRPPTVAHVPPAPPPQPTVDIAPPTPAPPPPAPVSNMGPSPPPVTVVASSRVSPTPSSRSRSHSPASCSRSSAPPSPSPAPRCHLM